MPWKSNDHSPSYLRDAECSRYLHMKNCNDVAVNIYLQKVNFLYLDLKSKNRQVDGNVQNNIHCII